MKDAMTYLKVLLAASALVCCFSSYSNATCDSGFEQNVTGACVPEGSEYIQNSSENDFSSETWETPDSVTELTIGDDQRVGVPLEFGFPLGTEIYTYSWMHSNGVVTFMSTFNWMCCNGLSASAMGNFSGTPYFNHMIAPLWTDTINTNVDVNGDGIDDSGHYIESYEYDDGTQSQRYFWRNVAEYYNNNNLNTFGVEIFDTGRVDIWHFEINITNHDTFVGFVGDSAEGEIQELDFVTRQEDYDFSGTDPTSALVFSGIPEFTDTAFALACNSNALYSAQCPGYGVAYLAYQCSNSSLYDPSCAGYAEAYAEYQFQQNCSANGLYDVTCSNYETAYIDNQCELNPLYSVSCDGYAVAFSEQEAEQEIIVVATVQEDYSEPQILDDAVVNELIFEQPEAFTFEIEQPAEVFIPILPELNIPEPVADSSTMEINIEQEMEEQFNALPIIDPEPEAEPVSEPEPEPIEEPISEPEPEPEVVEPDPEPEVEEPEEEPEPEPEEEPQPEEEPESEEEINDEPEPEEESQEEEVIEETVEEAVEEPKEETKNQKKKKLAEERAATLAERMGDAATLEQQQAIQNQIFALVNYNPDFLSYDTGLPDVTGYPDRQMPGGTINENQRGLRNGLAQELLHEKMIAQQYQ